MFRNKKIYKNHRKWFHDAPFLYQKMFINFDKLSKLKIMFQVLTEI